MSISLDWSILHWIQENLRCGVLDFLVPKITALGDGGILWIVLCLILLCTKKYRTCGIFMAISLVIGLLTGNLLLKNLIARDRPCWIDPSVELLIKNPHDYSFPSGHTLHSFIGAVSLWKTNRVMGYVAMPLAVLISLTRLYLYVHYPTDILAGAVLGTVIVFVVFYFGEKCRGKLLEQKYLKCNKV